MNKMKQAGRYFLFSVILGVLTAHAIIPAAAEEFIGEGGTNLSDITYAEDASVPIVVYVYVEDDLSNPYNNKNRDIAVEFGGDGEYYINGRSYQILTDTLYDDYGIIRMTSRLPVCCGSLYPTLCASDVKAPDSTTSLFSLNSDVPVNLEDGVAVSESDLQNGLNEFYFVGSHDSTWVAEHGKEKLSEMYRLLHSASGESGDSRFEQATENDALFQYWQQEMINDSTITGWQDTDGTVYTRADMQKLGYAVPDDSDTVDESTADDHTSDNTEVVIDDMGETSFEDMIEDTEDTQAIPDVVVPAQGGIQPIVIVIIGIVCAIAAVVIAYIRRERNESDLYID